MDTFSLYLSVLSARWFALLHTHNSFLTRCFRWPHYIIHSVPHVQGLYYYAHTCAISGGYQQFDWCQTSTQRQFHVFMKNWRC